MSWERKTDFNRLYKALMLQGEPDFVPFCEVGVDHDVKEAFLGKTIGSGQDEIEFWQKAGFDYVLLNFGLRQLLGPDFARKAGKTIDGKKVSLAKSVYGNGESDRAWANEGKGLITNMEEFNTFPWPTVDDLDFSALDEVQSLLPPKMKAIANIGYIFTTTWELMGFETFCIALIEDPELIGKIFQRVGEFQLETFKRVIDRECIGAVWQSDDIAYFSGLMIAPEYLRKYVYPWYKEMSQMCKARNKPHLLHSDGNITEALPDIVAAGFNAVHPIEPKCMDIVDVKKKWGDKICVIGNIDLNYTLTRGTPAEVEDEVKQRVKELAQGGGYCLSSSNSVTDYVPLENFNAMREATFKYGQYPINVN